MTGCEAKDLENFINDKSLPSGKSWKGAQLNLAREEGSLSPTGQGGQLPLASTFPQSRGMSSRSQSSELQ